MRKLVVPKFKSERQEAKWWDDHMDAAGKNLLAVMQNGTAHRGGPATLLRESRNITIRIARKLAEKKGIGYQTYMKMLLREALDREERRARKAG